MRGAGKGRYICWDLDETTGSFRDYRRMGLTNGIGPLLEGLTRLGIKHVITTAAWKEHAEYVLWQAGIRDLYEDIFDVHQICDKNYNKYYRPVAASLGIQPEEAPERLIVIGNLERDAPADLDLTYLYHPEGSAYNAMVYLRILSRLIALSDSWADAHAAMQDQNRYSIPVPGFMGGQQYIDDIWVGVGRYQRNVRPEKPTDRIISVYSVPESYRSEIEIIKINERSSFTQPALSL
ncbi:MAG: HAD family hydrolase [Candidatus Micrarchaeota archaeon]